MASVVFHKRPLRQRINVTLPPDVIHNMTSTAQYLGCNRSELIEYCFRLWGTLNPEVVESVWDQQPYEVVTLSDE